MSTNSSVSRREDNPDKLVREMIENDPRLREKPGPLEWWYRLTAPAEPPITAELTERELARQGRLTSTVLLFVAISLVILAVPTSIATHNPVLLVVVIVLLTIVSIALFLNKRGRGRAGGLMVVIFMNLSLVLAILSTPGGVNTNVLPIFDIIVVEPILVAFALLPLRAVFIVAAFNAVFISVDFAFQPHSSDLAQVLLADGYEVVTRPLYLLVFVLGVVYPVVRSALRAIVRGDRATVIASVQHQVAEQGKEIAEQKRLLERSVSQIIETHTRVANGDFSARVPLTTDTVLWQVAGSLNNLLLRFQRSRQAEQELEHLRRAASYYVEAMRQTNEGLIQWQRTGTFFDVIVSEHNMRVQASSTMKKPFRYPERPETIS